MRKEKPDSLFQIVMQWKKMDLFDYMRETNQEKEAPLASRMRPSTLEEVVGQQHISGKDKLLYRSLIHI